MTKEGEHNVVSSGLASPIVKAPAHLNSSGLRIEYADGKGRGVYGKLFSPLRYAIAQSPKNDSSLQTDTCPDPS